MSRKHWKQMNIDNVSARQIEEQIERLAVQYDTGWHMDNENPDIGTALAKLFAVQMSENISRFNDISERYHTEFVNMLDISLMPARPSSGVVVFSLISDTSDGTGVPKGTKLLSQGDDGVARIFETDHSIYVTVSRIDAVFMTQADRGRAIPLLGDYQIPGIVPDRYSIDEETGITDDISPTEEISVPKIHRFTLYGKGNGMGRDALLFFHPYLFNGVGDDIFIRISGNEKLVEEIVGGKYGFCYPGMSGELINVSAKLLEDRETFLIRKEEKSARFSRGRQVFDMISLVARDVIRSNETVDSVTFSARGEAKAPDSVTTGMNDLSVEAFAPFTDTLSLYAECYIGLDDYFSKEGARITLSFMLTFEDHRITLTSEDRKEDLRIIKKRPAAVRGEAFVNSYVDEIAIEYYNGFGWKRLPIEGDITTLFDTGREGEISFDFICPEDWEETTAGAYGGRCIRLQIIKSDNCYMRPALHHYPFIRDMKISYSYEEAYLKPAGIEVIAGTERINLNNRMAGNRPYVIFREKKYDKDALYLGFSKRVESGPAGILFSLDDSVRYNGLDIRFEYSRSERFRRMKVIDYTEGFTRSGIVAFVPPSDWSCTEIEGKKRYWIRLVRGKSAENNNQKQEHSSHDGAVHTDEDLILPKIKDIVINAVSVSNIETKEPQEIYLEESLPGMRFALGASGVLDADVWVNEMGRYSQERMNKMKDESPADIQVEKDAAGTITSFFVRWHEVERLETSEDPRAYALDRLSNELIFGDGITTWIPRVIDDVAVRFTVRCCDGSKGNVSEGSIEQTEGFVPFIGGVNNPLRTYGGSDIESLDNALGRGASILSSRNRLVSTDDFTRAILAYSDNIDQVSALTGVNEYGQKDEASITFILLMKEFEDGSYAFHRMVGGLKSYILDRCELTVVPGRLNFVEPVFVDISVSVWVNVIELDDSFEIQNLLTECLEDYLNPLKKDTNAGWGIGTIPKRPQILMRLGVLKSRAIVKRSVMVASYTDYEGYHEVNLEELKATPFMVCRSGEHKVHILY